jgi:hypothetical protein
MAEKENKKADSKESAETVKKQDNKDPDFLSLLSPVCENGRTFLRIDFEGKTEDIQIEVKAKKAEIKFDALGEAVRDKLISEGWQDLTEYAFKIPSHAKFEPAKEIIEWKLRHVHGNDDAPLSCNTAVLVNGESVQVTVSKNYAVIKNKDAAEKLIAEGWTVEETKVK